MLRFAATRIVVWPPLSDLRYFSIDFSGSRSTNSEPFSNLRTSHVTSKSVQIYPESIPKPQVTTSSRNIFSSPAPALDVAAPVAGAGDGLAAAAAAAARGLGLDAVRQLQVDVPLEEAHVRVVLQEVQHALLERDGGGSSQSSRVARLRSLFEVKVGIKDQVWSLFGFEIHSYIGILCIYHL